MERKKENKGRHKKRKGKTTKRPKIKEFVGTKTDNTDKQKKGIFSCIHVCKCIRYNN